MQNILPYNADKWREQFTPTKLYQKLADRYQAIFFEKFIEDHYFKIPTPRERMSTSVISATPWYYLNFLNWDNEVYDLGCGCNFFKPYFPRLIGISPDVGSIFRGDLHDLVDDEFFAGHQQYFESVFSICALHFRPLETLPELLRNFVAMLKKNGRGFLSLNTARMLENSRMFANWPIPEIASWISEQFDQVPCKILVLDVDLSSMDAFLDGNIRVVFENA